MYLFKDLAGVGIDIWQVKSGSIFDNIIITNDLQEAQDHAAKNFEPLRTAEKKLKEKHDEEERKKLEEEAKKNEAEGKKSEEEDEEDDASEKKEDHDEL